MDGVERERVEIDMVKLSGPAVDGFDNRLASLQLVELGFTDAVMLTADGDVVQPSEVLYKRPLLRTGDDRCARIPGVVDDPRAAQRTGAV